MIRHRLAIGNCIAGLVLAWGGLAWAASDTGAVVLMYHRFGESRYPSTNITIEQFEAHIEELKSGPYRVLPVADIIDALKRGGPLPDHAVGITIDDAYASVYREAWPRLRRAGFPFTVFVATDPVDKGVAGMMTWDQIREMAAAGVAIGHHSVTHPHMAGGEASLNARELEKAAARFGGELGRRPRLFAYPYGEASLAVIGLVREAGFAAAFGQHSGAIGGASDFLYLPRFSLNEKYGDVARFRRVVNTLPLPVGDVAPEDPLIAGNNPPAVGFTVQEGVGGLDRLACFASHEGKVRVERLGGTRIEVRMTKPLPKGRSRLNCTLPTESGRWRWLGRQFYVAE
ncbi:MAG: polysaccharide deacetylase family protein [Proteobacteria bacterium]|nr:polysaccharide deacetylase family protein [Pseudomonadota bacterium]